MDLVNYLKLIKEIRRIFILGPGAVGKSSLLRILKSKKSLNSMSRNDQEYYRTLFLELESLNISDYLNKDEKGVLQLFDVAGQLDLPIHVLKDFSDRLLKGVDVIVYLFGSNNVQSLLDLDKWLKLVDNYFIEHTDQKEPKFILVKNKIDLENTIDDSLVEAVLSNEKRFVKYFKISCMTGEGVEDLINYIIELSFNGGVLNIS